MRQSPVVGVALRPFGGTEFPEKLALNRTYFDALEAAGATVLPVPVPHDVARLRHQYDLMHGLLLPGGADVEPRRYGTEPRSDCGLQVMPEVDEVELALAGWALADGKPVLGICRGIQLLNVACGGTLWQDVNVQGATPESHDCEPRDRLVHRIEIETSSTMAGIVGTGAVEVNSLHHQAVREVGAQLRAVAWSPDGLVEGVEATDGRFVIGIQCHPEELTRTQPWTRSLFQAFAEAARVERAMGIEPT